MASELCLASKNVQFSTLLLSHLFLFFSFFLSHPLYFSYFIFFSPSLLKLLSFLSPLFFTTSLLLLLALTSPQFSDSQLGFLISAIRTKLHSNSLHQFDVTEIASNVNHRDFHQLEEFQFLRIAFDPFTFEIASEISPEFRAIGGTEEYLRRPPMEEQDSEAYWFLKEFDEFGNVTCIPEEKKIEPPGANSDKVETPLARIGSEAVSNDSNDGDCKVRSECVTKLMNNNNSRKIGGNRSWPETMDEKANLIGSYGSMRKDKEWKRTLAGKLFEERKSGEGEEGMDMLWETYESDSGKKTSKKGGNKINNNTKKKSMKKSEIGYCNGEKDEEEEEDDDEMVGPICCLQALKLSTGKMNLGMGRSNLGKISKAIKGIGWVHHVTRRASKKGGGVYK